MKRATALGSLLSVALGARAATAKPDGGGSALSRDDVISIIAANQRIVTSRGVQELHPIAINGATEWLSIRGRDRRNPLLLFLHGGPGSPTMPEAWTFQSPWEDFFTVVQWDQRGTGKTFASNDAAKLAPTMTGEQFISDAESVVRYLLGTFGKQQLFLLGQSWGSYVGLSVARRRPELLYAYIGTGQFIDFALSEAVGYRFALDRAKAHRNARAIRELEAIAPYPGPLSKLTIARISTQRNWVTYYGGLTWGRSSFAYDSNAWELSPEYTARDASLIDAGSMYSIERLLRTYATVSFEGTTGFRCPIFLLQGKHDYTTAHEVAEAWFERLTAPQKAYVTFEDSAHMVLLEQPGRFLDHLVTLARPIAVAAGDAAPAERITR